MQGHEHMQQVKVFDVTRTPERNSAYTDLFGPIIGTFTPQIATWGDHPQDVQRAWQKVVLPVRQRILYAVETGSVLVSANEAFDVLVAAGAPAQVIEYWQNCSIGDDLATIAFSRDEGELSLL